MTISEAKQNIGKLFKVSFLTGYGRAAGFDVIQKVDESGWVHGEWLSAPASDCRLKGEVPKQLLPQSKKDS